SSSPSPEPVGEFGSESTDFVAVSHPQQQGVAAMGQPNRRREVQAGVVRKLPTEYWGDIVRRVVQAEAQRASQASIHLNSGDEVFPAESAFSARCKGSQRPGKSQRIAELEAFIFRKVLFDDEILGDVPVMHLAGQDQLGLQFVSGDLSQLRVGRADVRRIPDDFFLNTAALVEIFILQVQNRIDPMFAFERTKAVFKSPTGEDGTVARRRLAFQIELRCPAGGDSILNFGVRGKVEVLAGTRDSERTAGFDLQVAGLFEVMVVSHEVRILLRPADRPCWAEKE